MSSPFFNDKQEKYALKVANQVKKQVKNETDGDILASIVLGFYKTNEIYQNINKIVFDVARKQESIDKNNIILNMLKTNRKDFDKIDLEKVNEVPENNDLGLTWQEYAQYQRGRIFYLASSHNDSAADHIDYQGKVYIDDKWKYMVQGKNLQKMIQSFISKNHIKTLQWVVGKPVWFITRPNCRHYFKAITIEDALTKDATTLVRNHKMHRAVGNEDMKPIWHSTNKTWYTRNNIENIIKKYQDRLDFYNGLYQVHKTPTLKAQIEKTRLLINKWRGYLTNNVKGL